MDGDTERGVREATALDPRSALSRFADRHLLDLTSYWPIGTQII